MATCLRTGDLSEIAVMKDLMEKGFQVCIPYGHDWRFDLVAYKDGEFLRIQVKTALSDSKGNDDRFVIRAFSLDVLTGKTKKYTVDEVDYIAGYHQGTGAIFYVPISEFEDQGEVCIRMNPDDYEKRTQNMKKVRHARDFEEIP